MPFVPAAITATFSAVSTFAASSAVAGFLVNTVSSIALSALATAIRGKPEVSTPGITTQTTTAGGTIPQRLIFGRYATAGQMVAPMMVYQSDGNPNEWLVYVISLADKPVTGLGRIFVDGKALTIEGSPAASLHGDTMGATVLDTDKDSLRNKIYVRFHDGRQTAADAYLRRVFGSYPERPWTADMIGTGVAYAVVTFKGKAQDGDYSGFPAIKFEVDGHPLLDPRTGTEVFTRNPAVIGWNILRGIDMPGGGVWGVGSRNFASSQVIAAANLCDQQAPRTDGTLRPRYQAGLEVSVSDEPHQALMEFVKAMGGDVADMGGTWLLSAGEPGGAVLSITDDDIIVTDSRSLKPYPGLDETINAIHASYPDPAQQWEAKEAVPIYNAAFEAADGGRRLIAEVDFPAVPYPQQIRALMGEMLADHRRMRTHVITLPPDALGLKLGDHIAWTSEINFYTSKLFKVSALRVDPLSLCVAVTLIERDPSDYDDDAARDGVLPTVPSPEPVTPAIVGVTGWDVQPVNAGGRPGIRMTWDPEINARSLSWVIRLASDDSEANSGTTSDLTRGENVQTAGLKGSTTYRVTGRLVIPGRGTESVTATVTTLPLGIGRDDLDEAVRDLLDDAREFIDETPGVIQGVRDEVAADIALVDTRITNETATLSGDVAAARQLAIDNLLVAQNYTDTSVQSETVARQTETGQLAARIDQITAAPTSSNLLVNGDFADGTTGWTGVTVANGKGTVTAAGAQQTFAATFSPAEMLQWRIEHSGPASQVRVAFLNGSGAVIGSEVVTNLAASATAKIGSGQHAPPDGTAQVRWRVTGTGLVIDNAAVTKIDQQTLARIQSLEVAVATDTLALSTYKTEIAVEFGKTNAAIGTEATTRANADTAIANRTTDLETTTEDHAGRINRTETTLATATESLAQLTELTEAESGRRDLVRDGTFARVATYWPGGALPPAGRLIARDEASTDARIRSVPAPRYFNLLPSDAAGTWRDTDFQSVTPGEVIDVRFDYVRGLATSVVPAERVVFYGPNKAVLGTPYTLRGDGFGADWRTASGQAIAPVGAVYAKTQAGVAATGTSAAGITNVSAMRTGAGYASRSTVQTLSQVYADDKVSLANYKVGVESRLLRTK